MDWLKKIPNFPSDDWVEVGPKDLFLDIENNRPSICPLGTAPKGFEMGMVIFYRNKKNNKFILAEYRNLQGGNPFLLRWGYEDTPGLEGIAIRKENEKDWRVKGLGEYLKWEVYFDEEKELITSFTPFFEKQRKPGLN